jgi:AraC family transcriptional regulator
MGAAINMIGNYTTTLEHRYRINAAAKFILENTGANLNITTLAKMTHCSPFHFHRLFSNYIGEPPAEYIRKERMKKAAILIYSGYSASEIAIEMGYVNVSSFGKAFKQVYGISPRQFKHANETELSKFLYRPPAPTANVNLLVRPRIIEEPGHTFYFIRKTLSAQGMISENINKVFSRSFRQWQTILQSNPCHTVPHRRIGFIRNLTSVDTQTWVCDAGFFFNSFIDLSSFSGEIHCGSIDRGKWAVFLHRGPYNTLWQTWQWIYNHWIWLSGYKKRNASVYEVYLNDKECTPECDLLTEIYFPIQ